jgi:hypothetical protein
MKSVMLALGIALVASDAYAISRYNSLSRSCQEVQGIIVRDGAAIMRYSGRTGVPLYGRYVADNRFCESSTRAEWRSIPTKDTPNCPVLECRYYDLDDDEILLFGR